jgi:AcrR family transcriptional regulator
MSSEANNTKERILRAAEKLFAEKGYLGAGVRDLEEAVGIRRGALYYHIESKEKLLFEISSRHVHEMTNQAWAIVGTTDTPEEKLHALARALIRSIAENTMAVTVFFRDWIWLEGERRDSVLAVRDKFEDAVESIMREGIEKSGWIDRGPLIAKGVLGMINYSYVWFRASGSVTPEQLADSFVDTLLLGLMPRDDSA